MQTKAFLAADGYDDRLKRNLAIWAAAAHANCLSFCVWLITF